MVKFGIIGCGNISKFHFNAIEKAGGKVTYIADINPQNAEKWIEKTGAEFTTDYKELIKSDNVDVVSVLASAKFHKEMVMCALDAGKHIVCEKTMANNAEEAYEIASAALKSKKLFFTTYMKRFFQIGRASCRERV